MAQPNKGTTFRVICRIYKTHGLTGDKLFKKIANSLTNAQIRRGELPPDQNLIDKNKPMLFTGSLFFF